MFKTSNTALSTNLLSYLARSFFGVFFAVLRTAVLLYGAWKALQQGFCAIKASAYFQGILVFLSKLGSTFYFILGIVLPWMIGITLTGMTTLGFWLVLLSCFLVAGLSMYYSWKHLSDEQQAIEIAEKKLASMNLHDQPQQQAKKTVFFHRFLPVIDLVFHMICYFYGAFYAFSQIILLPFLGVAIATSAGPLFWCFTVCMMAIGLAGGIHRYFLAYRHHEKVRQILQKIDKLDIQHVDAPKPESRNFEVVMHTLLGFVSYFGGTFFIIASIGLPFIFGVSLIGMSHFWITAFLLSSLTIGVLGALISYEQYQESTITLAKIKDLNHWTPQNPEAAQALVQPSEGHWPVLSQSAQEEYNPQLNLS